MKCRHCQHQLRLPLIDLGVMPPSNAYLTEVSLRYPEPQYPLKVWVCQHCWLVQTEDFTRPEQLFTEDYAYFSSTSASWLNHACQFALSSIQTLGLTPQSFVVELASNDGYLLKNYLRAGIPCLGVEPTAAAAAAARLQGLEVMEVFFGKRQAKQLKQSYGQADLIVANNVLAHVPDINDFIAGMAIVLAPDGVVSIEFPHVLNLLNLCQFDTIYHEHYSYLSLFTVQLMFGQAGLRVFDVESLPTHGGSLRVWLCHQQSVRLTSASVSRVLMAEQASGLQQDRAYLGFQHRVDGIVTQLQGFLTQAMAQGKRIVAYGAAAKGNTLLNYAGIKDTDITVVADAAKSKQGKFLPGSHIPIVSPADLIALRPDYVLILPWNIKTEVISQLRPLLPDTTVFVTAIPELQLQ